MVSSKNSFIGRPKLKREVRRSYCQEKISGISREMYEQMVRMSRVTSKKQMIGPTIATVLAMPQQKPKKSIRSFQYFENLSAKLNR
jgi:hypothetical protein